MAKCAYCKKEINQKDAVSLSVGKIHRYFCTEKERFLYQQNLEYKDRAYRIILKLLQTNRASTALWKEWTKWNKLCTNKKLFLFLKENQEDLNRSLNKEFKSDYAMVRYLSAIIQNQIVRYEPKQIDVPLIKKEVDFEFYKPQNSAKKRRVGFDVLERK